MTRTNKKPISRQTRKKGEEVRDVRPCDLTLLPASLPEGNPLLSPLLLSPQVIKEAGQKVADSPMAFAKPVFTWEVSTLVMRFVSSGLQRTMSRIPHRVWMETWREKEESEIQRKE